MTADADEARDPLRQVRYDRTMKPDRSASPAVPAALAACVFGIVPAAIGVRGVAMYVCLALSLAMLFVAGMLIGASRAGD